MQPSSVSSSSSSAFDIFPLPPASKQNDDDKIICIEVEQQQPPPPPQSETTLEVLRILDLIKSVRSRRSVEAVPLLQQMLEAAEQLVKLDAEMEEEVKAKGGRAYNRELYSVSFQPWASIDEQQREQLVRGAGFKDVVMLASRALSKASSCAFWAGAEAGAEAENEIPPPPPSQDFLMVVEEEQTQDEANLQAVDGGIAVLLAQYGCTPEEYFRSFSTVPQSLDVALPQGVIEVHEWLDRVKRVEAEMDACKRKIRRLEEDRAEQLPQQGAFNPRDRKISGQINAIEQSLRQEQGELSRHRISLWHTVFGARLINGNIFRAQMGPLIDARLQLALRLRKAEAERLLFVMPGHNY